MKDSWNGGDGITTRAERVSAVPAPSWAKTPAAAVAAEAERSLPAHPPSAPRYIELPEELYSLRDRYPAVVESLFMECIRCRQWVAVSVLSAAPQEAEAAEVATWSWPRHISGTSAEERGGGVAGPHRRSSREDSKGVGRCGTRGLYSKILEQVRQQQRAQSSCRVEPLPKPELYIPNPCSFVCGGWQCAWQPDSMADLREAWLSDIYHSFRSCRAAAAEVEGRATSSSAAGGKDDLQCVRALTASAGKALLRECRDELNESLSLELDVCRRAGLRPTTARTAKDTCDYGSLDLGSRVGASGGAAVSLSRGQARWVTAAVRHLLRPKSGCHFPDDGEYSGDGIMAACCWVACEVCGKLRRVAQPFPGGAPFICALAVAPGDSTGGGGCAVSEVDGLLQATMRMTEEELVYAALSSPFLPHPAKEQLQALSNSTAAPGCAGAAPGVAREVLVQTLLDEPILRLIRSSVASTIGGGTGWCSSPRRRSGSGPIDAHSFLLDALPVVRAVARSVKKKSVSGLVKLIQLSPAEIKQKREAVLRKNFLAAHDMAVGGDGDAVREETQPESPHRRSGSSLSQVLGPKTGLSGSAAASPRRKRDRAAVAGDDATASGTAVSRQWRNLGDRSAAISESPPSEVVFSTTEVPAEAPRLESVAGAGRRGGRAASRGTAQRGRPAKAGTVEGEVGELRKPGRRLDGEPRRARGRGAGRGRGRGRGVLQDDGARLAVAVDDDSGETEVVHWVQCDRCNKWRIVEKRVPSSIVFWECAMRWDASGRRTSCADVDDAAASP